MLESGQQREGEGRNCKYEIRSCISSDNGRSCCGKSFILKLTQGAQLDVHESVHRDTTMKITNKMHYID